MGGHPNLELHDFLAFFREIIVLPCLVNSALNVPVLVRTVPGAVFSVKFN
jgi:hypothetical protein